MKYVFKGVSVALATMGLFTSCLNEVNTAFAPGEIPAVTKSVNGVMVANTRYGLIYDKGLSSNASGQCLVVDFTYNRGNPETMNVEGNGYYTVQIAHQTQVNQQAVQAEAIQKEQLLPDELPLPYALSPLPDTQTYFDIIDNYLFLPSLYVSKGNTSAAWHLSFNPEEKPVEVDGRQVYPLYLRAVAQEAQQPDAEEEVYFALNAFQLDPWFDSLRNRGVSIERGLFVAIHYINAINAADSTQFSWAVTEPLQVK